MTGELDSAVGGYEQAAALGRELVAAHPGDPRCLQRLGGALYGLAASYTAVGRPAEAVAVLDECEQAYRGLAGTHDPAPLLADVRARRGLAQWERGHIASAVLELDRAVREYVRLADEDDQLAPDLARVLAVNARVLADVGDPDLAVASADLAVRQSPGGGAPDRP